MLKTAVVILNWNGAGYLRLFLGSVVSHSREHGSAVYVADNGSTDDSIKWISENFSDEVTVIRLDRNYGFAGGYNLALSQIESEYFVLLNSDVEVTEGWLGPLVNFMDANPSYASCQPKILSFKRKEYFEHAGAAGCYIDKFGFPFCRGRIFHIEEKDSGQYDADRDIFWSSGACMIVRRSAWIKCGGFDADFFAHMEEIDLCWRFHREGYRVAFIHDSAVYHVGGGALPYSSPFKVYLNFRNSLFMLYKNLPPANFRLLLFARKTIDGIAALSFLFKGELKCFAAVIRAHYHYYRSMRELKLKRQAPGLPPYDYLNGPVLNKSIVFEFYARGRRTFGSLKTDFDLK